MIDIKQPYTEELADSLTEEGSYVFPCGKVIDINHNFKSFQIVVMVGKGCLLLEHRENNLPSMINKNGFVRYCFYGKNHRSNGPYLISYFNKTHIATFALKSHFYQKQTYFLLIL